MGYSYGRKSEKELSTCHPDIQVVYRSAINYMDITILQGHRSEAEQLKKFNSGFSKLKRGKHNDYPSNAIDAGPYKKEFKGVDWRTNGALIKAINEKVKIENAKNKTLSLAQYRNKKDEINIEIIEIRENLKHWTAYGALILGIAYGKGINLRWGQDWDGDWDFTEHSLVDSPHMERVF